MIDADRDYDSCPKFSRTSTHKAIKEHRCGECNKPILPGQTYELITGKWDCGFESYKTCSACVEIRNKFMSSWGYGCIWEDLSDCARDMKLKDLDGLSGAAISKLEEQFEKSWSEMLCDEECGSWCEHHRSYEGWKCSESSPVFVILDTKTPNP
jgi:hypothetical protein